MKRKDLVNRIKRAAANKGCQFALLREGGNHSVFRYGSQNVVIPRHNEINEQTAKGVLRDLGIR